MPVTFSTVSSTVCLPRICTTPLLLDKGCLLDALIAELRSACFEPELRHCRELKSNRQPSPRQPRPAEMPLQQLESWREDATYLRDQVDGSGGDDGTPRSRRLPRQQRS